MLSKNGIARDGRGNSDSANLPPNPYAASKQHVLNESIFVKGPSILYQTNQKISQPDPLQQPFVGEKRKLGSYQNSVDARAQNRGVPGNPLAPHHQNPHFPRLQQPQLNQPDPFLFHPSYSNDALDGPGSTHRTNTSTLRPVFSRPGALRLSQYQALQQQHLQQQQQTPSSLWPSGYRVPSLSTSARNNMQFADMILKGPNSNSNLKPNIKKPPVDRYVPSAAMKPKQKRRPQQQNALSDGPSLNSFERLENAPQQQYKGVVAVTCEDQTNAANLQSNPNRIRGMPVKQPKVISLETKFSVEFTIFDKVVKLGPFNSALVAANAYDRAM